jgi:uncharacterized damage-inducible protein DinB
MRNTFKMLAGYNSWANQRLYDAAQKMSDSGYRDERGAFFGSVHGTLNHLLVADRIWLKRFGVRDEAPTTLNTILFENLTDLRVARDAEDATIESWISGLSDADLTSVVSYRTMVNPDPIRQPMNAALTHFFNHQTHHRGQVHALMTAVENRDFAPSLDLIVYQRTSGVGMA